MTPYSAKCKMLHIFCCMCVLFVCNNSLLWRGTGLQFVYTQFYNMNCVCVLATQSCVTLWHPMDCSPSGSSVHGIFQTRTLAWVTAIPFSSGTSQPRDRNQVSCTAGKFFIIWAMREAPEFCMYILKESYKYFIQFIQFLSYCKSSLNETFLTMKSYSFLSNFSFGILLDYEMEEPEIHILTFYIF